MRWRMLCMMMLFIPSFGAAQGLVLSGEHDGFTRVAAPIPSGATWRVEQAGRRVTLIVDDLEQGFDISGIFELIPRERIVSVAQSTNSLSLILGCDCRVAAFVAEDRFVVMDVTSPGVSRPVAFVPKFEDLAADVDRSSASASGDDAGQIAAATNTAPPFPLDLPMLARQPLSPTDQDALEQMQLSLSQELGSAATRGLLTPSTGINFRPRNGTQSDPEEVDGNQTSETGISGVLTSPRRPNNMRITSSRDIAGIQLPPTDQQSLSGFACPASETIDIAQWSDGSGFDRQLGTLRQSLYKEFDLLDQEVARRLAKLYIHFGFGAEALQVLRLSDELAQSEGMLRDVGHILEFGQVPEDSTLPNLLDCPTDVALWAILARDITVSHSVDASAALLALNRLPLHLRQILASALSDRLLAHGDTEAAAKALRTVERVPAALSTPAKLSQARIALDQGAMEKGAKKLEDVIDDSSEQSPAALIALVDTRLAAGQPIDPETAGLIEAYAKEHERSALGPALQRAHILALAKSGQFDAAFAGIVTSEKLAAPTLPLRMQLIKELTKGASDVVFLDILFDQPEGLVNRLPPTQKISLAERLASLGFGERAQTILENMPARPRNRARQLLLARIALDLSQPRRAQAALIELSGPEVDTLRAEAMQMAGDFADATSLFASLEDQEAALQNAWLAGEDQAGRLSNDPLFGAVTALDGAEVAASTELDGMLARGDAALEESRAARQTLSDLLQASELGFSQ